MATSGNPLADMTGAVTPFAGDEEVPDETFRDTALPGFKQAVRARRSIRVFDSEPIPDEVMRDCLRDATLAPSSSNLQPYELYRVRDGTTRERQPAATTAGELVVVMARRDLWKTNLDKVWAGSRRPEGLYGARVRLPHGDLTRRSDRCRVAEKRYEEKP